MGIANSKNTFHIDLKTRPTHLSGDVTAHHNLEADQRSRKATNLLHRAAYLSRLNDRKTPSVKRLDPPAHQRSHP
jgi:hypothetical protein